VPIKSEQSLMTTNYREATENIVEKGRSSSSEVFVHVPSAKRKTPPTIDTETPKRLLPRERIEVVGA